MCRVCGDDAAQNAAGNYVAHKVIVHHHQTDEHRSTENDDYELYCSIMRHRNQPDCGERQDPARMPGRKTADVIAALKRMETVRACADKRWIIMGPRFWPIA